MPSLKGLRFLKRPEVRASAPSALNASAAVPNSGFAFVDNSQGASAAVAELAKSLDVALDQIFLEKEPGDQLQLQLDRLADEAAKYTNSKLDADVGEEWNCSYDEAQLLSIACACSSAVYDAAEKPSSPSFQFNRLSYIEPSIGGTSKGTALWSVESANKGRPSERILVVAIRGTASHLDRMLNLNGKRADARSLINFRDFENEYKVLPDVVSAHSGFLSSAKALLPVVLEHIKKEKDAQRVLFTGHSAGGTVASLLFAHFLCGAAQDFSSTQFSLISFGAAPATSPDLTPTLRQISHDRQNPGIMLAIVNEYDVVPRADAAYIRSLVDLYRSRYGLAPITDEAFPTPTPEGNQSFDASSLKSNDSKTLYASMRSATSNLEWPVPVPQYGIIGEIVVLKMTLESAAKGSNGAGDVKRKLGLDLAAAPVLGALKVRPEVLARCLFCDVAVHRRAHYARRVEMILAGKFNGKGNWGGVEDDM